MTTQDLKKAIENLAKEENISFMDACKAMQGASATKGDEKMIMAIHKIKMSHYENIQVQG